MNIIITEWALGSYTDLRGRGLFSLNEYRRILRPDILRLRSWPEDPCFRAPHTWGPAQDRQGNVIEHGYKMKWHNFGNGNVELRLCVAIVQERAFLCHAYVKTSAHEDRRESAKLERRIRHIAEGTYVHKGQL